SSLAVAGIAEVVAHIPRIRREFHKLVGAAESAPPRVAVLTDSPDFHLRLARRLKKLGVPVVYLVAPQVWAWRKGRLRGMKKVIDRLLCIFPFEEQFFRQAGIDTAYIGHPLARLVKASAPRDQLRRRYGVAQDDRLIALLPGSRHGEVK